eukprot:TRINITY_DN9886_c0_g1_i1.p1 TRINITY_DN9886_c0_g1~~TRINITY_DN9886_c0_g1_i1.p1  ORF type:complete len:484 (+),score=77.63 TRINITY_DN9886_c0_g1_i1:142-1593(+)
MLSNITQIYLSKYKPNNIRTTLSASRLTTKRYFRERRRNEMREKMRNELRSLGGYCERVYGVGKRAGVVSRAYHRDNVSGHQGHNFLEMHNAQDGKEGRQVTIVGLVANLLLGIGKIVSGVIGHSAAMVADGIHSFGDLATDFVTLFTHSQARKKWSSKFPYGLGKYEAIGATIVSIVLLVSGAGIIVHSVENVIDFTPELTNHIALYAAIVSLVVKEILYRWTLAVAKRENSEVLKANAWHHRSDAITSVVALIGIGAAIIGIPYADPIAGLAVSGFIIKAGWNILRSSVLELIDSQEVASDHLREIGHHLDQMDDVEGYHNLRVRKMGPYMLVDLHLSVNPIHTVSSAHQVAEHVRTSIMEKFGNVREVMVHIEAQREPGTDSMEDFTIHPSPSVLKEDIKTVVNQIPEIKEVVQVIIYYREQKIIPSVTIKLDGDIKLTEAEEIGKKAKALLMTSNPEFESVVVKLILTQWKGLKTYLMN